MKGRGEGLEMKLADRMWDNEILSYIANLVEIARIQSTESSNKIEGIVTTSTRIKQLMDDKTTPKSRDESEIVGYRNILNTIHESHNYIPVRPTYILPLHTGQGTFYVQKDAAEIN